MEELDSFLFHIVNLSKGGSAVAFPDCRLFLLGALMSGLRLFIMEGTTEGIRSAIIKRGAGADLNTNGVRELLSV